MERNDLEASRLGRIARIPSERHIVPGRFFQRADMPVQPEGIRSSTSFVRFGISNIVSENLTISKRAASPFAIADQVHRAGRVIVVKTIARATVRSRLGVIAAEKKFRKAIDRIGVPPPGSYVMVQTKRRVLDHVGRIGVLTVRVDQSLSGTLQARAAEDFRFFQIIPVERSPIRPAAGPWFSRRSIRIVPQKTVGITCIGDLTFVVVQIHGQGQPYVLQVRPADRLARHLFDLPHGRYDDRQQDRNNGNDHQQFDQGKTCNFMILSNLFVIMHRFIFQKWGLHRNLRYRPQVHVCVYEILFTYPAIYS